VHRHKLTGNPRCHDPVRPQRVILQLATDGEAWKDREPAAASNKGSQAGWRVQLQPGCSRDVLGIQVQVNSVRRACRTEGRTSFNWTKSCIATGAATGSGVSRLPPTTISSSIS